jgi:hypothetical protein
MTSIRFHNDTGSLHHLWYESHKNLLTSLCIDLGHTDKVEEMVQKYLGEPIKIKALKDPNKPKRAKSGYLFYCDVHRPAVMVKLKAETGTLRIADVAKLLGASWKALSTKGRVKFDKLADKDRERYKDEMEVYNA